ncbi:regulatory protein RecX [Flavobacterium agricola]|uniref:regulatory protein RecX n=1 Tax=Flavobacterium agricola TaxID=2870839 RepID=UPI002222BE55|nr:regulatory protein RecX [Flavobacterium agricola]
MKSLPVNEVLNKLEYYCSYQDRCYKEVEYKLFEYHLTPEEKQNILIALIENKYLNEERFAISFTRGKHFYKNWGRNKIKQELKFRDISARNIETALKEINEAYETRFLAYAEKKWESINEKDILKKKNKFISQLSYKGYESHLIFDFLNDIENKKA